jgi:dienelactone hydrolase
VLDDQTLATTTTLPTYLWRPNSPDRFPLVVFIHGYDVGPLTYQRFCRRLAQTGFVVAAPAFPLEDPALGFGLSRSDLPEEALDVRFVVRALTHGALARSLLPGAVAVVGHSDGADVALMVGYEEGLRDPQVRAVVADAPDPMTGTVVIGGPPLLLLQGSDDPVVPFSSSQTVFEQVRATTLYLTLVGAGHLGPIQGGTRWTPALDASVRLFLDATLRGAPRARLVTELRELPYVLVRAHR